MMKLNNLTCDYCYSTAHAIAKSKVCLATAGTVNLEIARENKHQIVLYKTNALNYYIAKALIKTPYISLPNIISNEYIIKEYIQNECKAQNIIKQIKKLSIEKPKYDSLNLKMSKVHIDEMKSNYAKLCI